MEKGIDGSQAVHKYQIIEKLNVLNLFLQVIRGFRTFLIYAGPYTVENRTFGFIYRSFLIYICFDRSLSDYFVEILSLFMFFFIYVLPFGTDMYLHQLLYLRFSCIVFLFKTASVGIQSGKVYIFRISTVLRAFFL